MTEWVCYTNYVIGITRNLSRPSGEDRAKESLELRQRGRGRGTKYRPPSWDLLNLASMEEGLTEAKMSPQNQQLTAPPRDSDVWQTPLYQQYWKNKDKCPGALLFFRLGDFYELFGQDALEAAPLLGVQLTARNKDKDNPVPMCGVPAHAVDAYADKLLAVGRKVALCEQIEEASPQKKISRAGYHSHIDSWLEC